MECACASVCLCVCVICVCFFYTSIFVVMIFFSVVYFVYTNYSHMSYNLLFSNSRSFHNSDPLIVYEISPTSHFLLTFSPRQRYDSFPFNHLQRKRKEKENYSVILINENHRRITSNLESNSLRRETHKTTDNHEQNHKADEFSNTLLIKQQNPARFF